MRDGEPGSAAAVAGDIDSTAAEPQQPAAIKPALGGTAVRHAVAGHRKVRLSNSAAAAKEVAESAKEALQVSPRRVGGVERIVAHIGIAVPALRIQQVGARIRRIGTVEPPQRSGIIPGPEVIEPRPIGIPLLPGKLLRDVVRALAPLPVAHGRPSRHLLAER